MYFVQSNIQHVSGFWRFRSQASTGALPLDPAGGLPRSPLLSPVAILATLLNTTPNFTGRHLSVLCSARPALATIELTVCSSVCPSVTRWHCVKTTQARITKSSLTDSPRTLVSAIKSSSRNLNEFTASNGVKRQWGRKNWRFSANESPSLRNGTR